MAASGTRKKFANSNLNTLLGAPKESAKANFGPAVRSGGTVKPVAKPKGLVSLGKAPTSSTAARKGAAWNQLEEEAKKREEESAKKKEESALDWADIDFNDIQRAKEQEEQAQIQASPVRHESPEVGGDVRARPERCEEEAEPRPIRKESRSWADQTELSDEVPAESSRDRPSSPPRSPPPRPEQAREVLHQEVHLHLRKAPEPMHRGEEVQPRPRPPPPSAPPPVAAAPLPPVTMTPPVSVAPDRSHVDRSHAAGPPEPEIPKQPPPRPQAPAPAHKEPEAAKEQHSERAWQVRRVATPARPPGPPPPPPQAYAEEVYQAPRAKEDLSVPAARSPKETAPPVPEAEDTDESTDGEGDEPPPEHAVLDLMVPRTALVINISHVLKRLNGCCSLNQLTKAVKSFKEKTGMSLEAFLRANPVNFKLEGRIVYLVGRDGEKWKPPPKQEAPGPEAGPDRGKGAKGKEARRAGEAENGRRKGQKGAPKGDFEERPRRDGGKGKGRGKAYEGKAYEGKAYEYEGHDKSYDKSYAYDWQSWNDGGWSWDWQSDWKDSISPFAEENHGKAKMKGEWVAWVLVGVLEVLGQVQCAVFVLLLKWGTKCKALSTEVSAAPPHARHRLAAEFDLWQVQLDVLFLPDPALPWKQVPPPLRIPPVPLYHFVHGPPAVRLLCNRASAGGPGCWEGERIEMALQADSLDYAQEAEVWLALTRRRNRKRNTTWTWPSTLPFAADAVERRTSVALALQSGGLLVQAAALGAQRRRPAQAKALNIASGLLEIAVTASTLLAFVCYLSRFHSRLHLISAEFVFAYTDGATVIWPADFQLSLGPCSLCLAGAGLLSLASSLVLVTDTVNRARRSKPKARPPLRRTKSSTMAAADLLMEASGLKLKSHDGRVVAGVLVAMTLLALLLGLMAFLLGRGGVEDGVSQAFRGPEDNLRKTSRAAQAVSHFVGRCTRTVLGGGQAVALGAVHRVTSGLKGGAHVAAVATSPLWSAVRRAVSWVAKGVTRAVQWLAKVADAAAQASQEAQRKAQPKDSPDKAPAQKKRFGLPFGKPKPKE
ncbi:unnamed protein product [Effrenium voratum]|nr:unnamed protein product [Effrenium voratum]